MNANPSDPNGLPKGKLYRQEGNAQAQLIPAGSPGLYNFRFGTPITGPGILSDEFAIKELSCGAQCGGLQVVYTSNNSNARWIAYPDPKYTSGYAVGFYIGRISRDVADSVRIGQMVQWRRNSACWRPQRLVVEELRGLSYASDLVYYVVCMCRNIWRKYSVLMDS